MTCKMRIILYIFCMTSENTPFIQAYRELKNCSSTNREREGSIFQEKIENNKAHIGITAITNWWEVYYTIVYSDDQNYKDGKQISGEIKNKDTDKIIFILEDLKAGTPYTCIIIATNSERKVIDVSDELTFQI